MKNFGINRVRFPKYQTGTPKNGIQLQYNGPQYYEIVEQMKKERSQNSYNEKDINTDERSDHRIDQKPVEKVFIKATPRQDSFIDLGGTPSDDSRTNAERNKDYWHPLKGAWQRNRTLFNLGKHPVQGIAKTAGTSAMIAGAPYAIKDLMLNPFANAVGIGAGMVGGAAGEKVDNKLGVDGVFSTTGGMLFGIPAQIWGTGVTKRGLELMMRANSGGSQLSPEFLRKLLDSKKDVLKYMITGNKKSLYNIARNLANKDVLYQGFSIGGAAGSDIPLENDPISNFLYGSEPAWAKVIDTDDYGIHSKYVQDNYPNKKVRVFEAKPHSVEIMPHQDGLAQQIVEREGVIDSFRILDNQGRKTTFDASGHIREWLPNKEGYRLQDIWKFNPRDYVQRHFYPQQGFYNKMMQELGLYGLKVLDYHGTPFITRTPFIYNKRYYW